MAKFIYYDCYSIKMVQVMISFFFILFEKFNALKMVMCVSLLEEYFWQSDIQSEELISTVLFITIVTPHFMLVLYKF
jgi:hypothetical protein